MKICPICNQTYSDDSLNFCLNDGGNLTFAKEDNSPPTLFMNKPRETNPNWSNYQPPNYQNQQITQRQNVGMYGQNQFPNRGLDQTLPTVSLILGILSLMLFCCFGGVPLGLGALITGYLGMNNASNNPMQYGGKGMAIAGLIMGGLGLLISISYFIFALIVK